MKDFLNVVAVGVLICAIIQIAVLFLFPKLQEKCINSLKNTFLFDAKSLSRAFIIMYFGIALCIILINTKIIEIKELQDMPFAGELAIWILLIASLVPSFKAKRAIKDGRKEERKIAILKLRQIFLFIVLIFVIFIILSLGFIRH